MTYTGKLREVLELVQKLGFTPGLDNEIDGMVGGLVVGCVLGILISIQDVNKQINQHTVCKNAKNLDHFQK